MGTIREKTRVRIINVIAAILFVALQVLIIALDRTGRADFNGVILTVQCAICLLVVLLNHSRGIKVAMVLMIIGIIMTTQSLIVNQSLAALPGVTNSVIFVVVILILNHQLKERDKAAVTDYLTGLINRRGFAHLFRSKKEDKRSFHLVYIELANFRAINDNHSHEYGDMLLREIAYSINSKIGKQGEVVRLDGNEFVALVDETPDIIKITDDVLQAIRDKASIVMDGAKIENVIIPYAGIATYPTDSMDAQELLKFADIAMSRAKTDKAKTPYIYNEEMSAEFLRELEVEKYIRLSMEKDYFFLVYQPQYRAKDHSLRGFEALLRLETPEGIFVSPGEFIPVAEKGGLVLEIDYYVIERAMREFKDTIRSAKDAPILSVNISAKNISTEGFAERVREMVERIDFPPENLEIEVTEYCLAESPVITMENINLLRELGVRVALDDFGTGYTSLAYLAKLQIDLLKIDKSLVDGIATSSKGRGFVHAIISLGHMMGCEVLAEGVEDEKQLEIIQSQDCDFVQGFVWNKPLDFYVAKDIVK